MEYSKEHGGFYTLPGPLDRPLVVGFHGFGMSPGDEWWRMFSFPKRSGLLDALQQRRWGAIFLSAGWNRNWSIGDWGRVVDAVRDRSQGRRVIGVAHSDGVLGMLAADSYVPDLFDALICVGGVYDPKVDAVPGNPLWFTCGEHDVRAVRGSLGPFVSHYESAGRTVRSAVVLGSGHAWPTQLNASFLDWAEF